MLIFEIVIALLLAGVLLSLWGDRIGVPYPASWRDRRVPASR